MTRTSLRFAPAGLLLLALVAGSSTASARPAKTDPLHGFTIGVGLHAFEPDGSGHFSFPQGDYKFNLKRLDSRPLVDDTYVLHLTNQVGLGWDNKQLIGISLNGGYNFTRRLSAEMLFRAFLPKKQELFYGNPAAPNTGTITYMHRQETHWWQWGVRAQANYAVFEALPIWYFSLGGEFTWFKTQLRYNIYQVDNTGSRDMLRLDSFTDAHTAVGLILGTGINFREIGSTQFTTVAFTYSLTKYSGNYFKRKGDLYVGGLTLEVTLRFMARDVFKKFL